MREREEGTPGARSWAGNSLTRSIMGLVVRLVETSVSDDQSRSGTDFLKRWTESQAWSKGRPYFAARKLNPILHTSHWKEIVQRGEEGCPSPTLLSKNQDEVEQRQQQVAAPHLHPTWVPAQGKWLSPDCLLPE